MAINFSKKKVHNLSFFRNIRNFEQAIESLFYKIFLLIIIEFFDKIVNKCAILLLIIGQREGERMGKQKQDIILAMSSLCMLLALFIGMSVHSNSPHWFCSLENWSELFGESASEKFKEQLLHGVSYAKSVDGEIEELKISDVYVGQIDRKTFRSDLRKTLIQQFKNGQLSFYLTMNTANLSDQEAFEMTKEALFGSYYGQMVRSMKVVTYNDVNKGQSQIYYAFQWIHRPEEDQIVQQWAKFLAEGYQACPVEEKLLKIKKDIQLLATVENLPTYGEADSHSPYSLIVKHKGSPSAYAALFQLTCDYANIPSRIISGQSLTSEEESSNIHFWNQVYYQGKWQDIEVAEPSEQSSLFADFKSHYRIFSREECFEHFLEDESK